jgi:hypothetical protein
VAEQRRKATMAKEATESNIPPKLEDLKAKYPAKEGKISLTFYKKLGENRCPFNHLKGD